MSDMTVQELKSTFLDDLAQLYPKEEIQSFFNLLVSHKLKLSRTDIALNPDLTIQQSYLAFFLNALTDLQHEKPIQYIIGETEFYGLPFMVNKNVLIPRPETEELVEWVLEDGRQKTEDQKQVQILDIGTGSGCIAITLAKNLTNASVFALDISKEAIKIARQNAELNKVNIHFIEGDILNTNVMLSGVEALRTDSVESYLNEKSLSLKFDFIISNPPYVRELEKREIQNNVLENEPHLALFVDDNNPLLFYDKIADFAKEHLAKNGQLFFEINQYLGKETIELLKQKEFTSIELKKDIFGNDRIIKASF